MTTPTTKKEHLASELEANLRYPWLRSRFLLTDGAKYLAETAQAFWLMDAIASHQTNKQVAAEPFQIWKLTVNEQKQAALTCTDGSAMDTPTRKCAPAPTPNGWPARTPTRSGKSFVNKSNSR